MERGWGILYWIPEDIERTRTYVPPLVVGNWTGKPLTLGIVGHPSCPTAVAEPTLIERGTENDSSYLVKRF